jgi:Protein kinase domain.
LISHDLRKIKLSDFGSALEEGENKITDNLVARYYRPPEIYFGYPYDYSLDV